MWIVVDWLTTFVKLMTANPNYQDLRKPHYVCLIIVVGNLMRLIESIINIVDRIANGFVLNVKTFIRIEIN